MCAGRELMPCLANSPSDSVIWQRPQSARPPHTESMSTPSLRAACSSGVPSGNRPRRPDGVKTTRGRSVTTGVLERSKLCRSPRRFAGRKVLGRVEAVFDPDEAVFERGESALDLAQSILHLREPCLEARDASVERC